MPDISRPQKNSKLRSYAALYLVFKEHMLLRRNFPHQTLIKPCENDDLLFSGRGEGIPRSGTRAHSAFHQGRLTSATRLSSGATAACFSGSVPPICLPSSEEVILLYFNFFQRPSPLIFCGLGPGLTYACQRRLFVPFKYFDFFSQLSPLQTSDCRQVTVITRTISSTEQPRERSFMGCANPCRNGP